MSSLTNPGWIVLPENVAKIVLKINEIENALCYLGIARTVGWQNFAPL
jgi:hypothetical protein